MVPAGKHYLRFIYDVMREDTISVHFIAVGRQPFELVVRLEGFS
jgi:hypothetical protein